MPNFIHHSLGARTRRAAAQCGLPRRSKIRPQWNMEDVSRSETEGASFSSPVLTGEVPSKARRRGSSRLTIASPLLLLSLLSLLLLPACVQRKIRVTSTPPGARVLLNDQEIGRTPVETRFTFYGGYDIQLIKPGFEHLHELKQAKAPLHEYPVIDLAATAVPADINHTIEWHFDLTPVAESLDPEAAREDLLNRAEDLREQARTTAD